MGFHPHRPSSARNSTDLTAWDFADLNEWRALSPDTLLWPDDFASTQKDIGDLPQLGGNFMDRVHRPTGLPSLRLSCPIVGTEEMNAISARTHNLTIANGEILQRSFEVCNRSLSCRCIDCSAVRSDLLNALRFFAPTPPAIAPVSANTTAAAGAVSLDTPSRLELPPPPPAVDPPRPPSTPPPTMARSRSPRLPSIVEGDELMSSAFGNDTIRLPSTVESLDQRWLDAHLALGPWSPNSATPFAQLGTEEPPCTDRISGSDRVTHISQTNLSAVDPFSDNEWDWADTTTSHFETRNAVQYDIASDPDNSSVRSYSSWNVFDLALGSSPPGGCCLSTTIKSLQSFHFF